MHPGGDPQHVTSTVPFVCTRVRSGCASDEAVQINQTVQSPEIPGDAQASFDERVKAAWRASKDLERLHQYDRCEPQLKRPPMSSIEVRFDCRRAFGSTGVMEYRTVRYEVIPGNETATQQRRQMAMDAAARVLVGESAVGPTGTINEIGAYAVCAPTPVTKVAGR